MIELERQLDVARRLAFQAPTKGSGKTLALELMENVAPRAIMAGSITASALFRIIDLKGPTLLIDEADNVLHRHANPELLAILNSGHRRKGAFWIVERGGLSWCQSCERAAQQG